jgi:hypothetical protein
VYTGLKIVMQPDDHGSRSASWTSVQQCMKREVRKLFAVLSYFCCYLSWSGAPFQLDLIQCRRRRLFLLNSHCTWVVGSRWGQRSRRAAELTRDVSTTWVYSNSTGGVFKLDRERYWSVFNLDQGRIAVAHVSVLAVKRLAQPLGQC